MLRGRLDPLATIAVIAATIVATLHAGCSQKTTTVYVRGFPAMIRPHDLVQTTPPYGASLESAPLRVSVEFAKPIRTESEMSVWLDGRRIDGRDDAIVLGGDRKMDVGMRNYAGEGLYRVDFKVAWREGGVDDGRFYFRVKRTAK